MAHLACIRNTGLWIWQLRSGKSQITQRRLSIAHAQELRNAIGQLDTSILGISQVDRRLLVRG